MVFFKHSTKINKKEKTKLFFKTTYNWTREIKHMVSKIKGGGLLIFLRKVALY